MSSVNPQAAIRSRRLLFVAPSGYTLGGVATWLDYLLPGLAKQGWEPLLGLVSGHWHDVEAYRAIHPYPHLVTIDNPSGSAEGRLRSLEACYRRLRPDLVVGVNVVDTYAAVARMRQKGEPAPRVAMTIHAIQPNLYEDVARYRQVLDGVVCTNRLAAHLAATDGGQEFARVHYAPYGVATPAQATLHASQRPSAPIEERSFAAPPVVEPLAKRLRIAYVGRMDQWQKRMQDLPPILEGLERRGVAYQLLLAGSGPEEGALKERLASRIVNGQVQFLGTLSPSELVEQIYRRCDLLLLTSYWETGPIVLWEAMAHRLAVVSSAYIGSGREGGLKDGENCLLFPIGDTEAAATALARLTDEDERARLITGGESLIQERYSLDRSIAAWDQCLQAILNAPARLAPTELPPTRPAGRLDRLLGIQYAETVRRVAGIRFRHSSAGGEWPHSSGQRGLDDEGFWAEAAAADQKALSHL